MTDCDTWKIGSAAEAARVRAWLARLTADADVPVVERTRFLTSLTAQLRRSLGAGDAEIVVAAPQAGGRLRITVRPYDGTPWRHTLTCRAPLSRPWTAPADLDPVELAHALLAQDEDTAALLAQLDEAENQVRFHREELHQTNQGVLALHAELEAAAQTQRALLEAEQAARADAENARRLLTFQAGASAAVTASLDHAAILQRLPDLLIPDFAEKADIWLFDEDEASSPGDHPAAAVAAARSGRPQHAALHPLGLPGVDDLPPSVLSPERPLLCIPLTAPRLLGVLTLTPPGPRFDPDAAVMLIDLAGRWAVALDHARSYEQHRDVAEALQQAQLTELPAAEGLRLAARYLPATRGLNIGGDWYDAFVQPDGSVLTVIGDVTGHGLNAAVLMGQLRTALRAYAAEDDSPARILTRLHRMLIHQHPALYATAVVARFRPGDPTLVWAAAGHPPALVRTPDGTVEVLDTKPGIMLGVPLPYTYEDHTLQLPTGSTVVLYTDGLVERRALGIEPGIERLADALGALSPADLEDLDACAEAVLKPLLHDSERDDDICLMLCRTLPVPDVGAPQGDTVKATTGEGTVREHL
ncbi:PP2C family protein-serine/threonine phosphatase [Streptomyces cylindrosporus]|uniref:Serine/threonine-protein phosphatase n=1 Tax=Streptomyces cylindrosporus TaxID=2927583 RepID=A0ABS9Y8M4_9ACTN|nr:PP2C family protein-serine/threonine phosphatase [Streptomyces cylindrosporus]MCI3273582.1 serine/threonine-protein phosphatase [Streptomyces cylindrosporus]